MSCDPTLLNNVPTPRVVRARASLLTLGAVAGVGAQPNFTGTWVLDRADSQIVTGASHERRHMATATDWVCG